MKQTTKALMTKVATLDFSAPVKRWAAILAALSFIVPMWQTCQTQAVSMAAEMYSRTVDSAADYQEAKNAVGSARSDREREALNADASFQLLRALHAMDTYLAAVGDTPGVAVRYEDFMARTLQAFVSNEGHCFNGAGSPFVADLDMLKNVGRVAELARTQDPPLTMKPCEKRRARSSGPRTDSRGSGLGPARDSGLGRWGDAMRRARGFDY